MTMIFLNIPKAFVIFFFLNLPQPNLTSETLPTFLYNSCYNPDPYFSPDSIFRRNLDLLLSSLLSNSTSENRFYHLSVGSDPDNVVYGLFLCLREFSISLCRDCAEMARTDILELCPAERASIIMYEECELRYSSQNFFGKAELEPTLKLGNVLNKSQVEGLRVSLERTTRNLLEKIADDRSGRRFATEESSFTSNETIYLLGQCTLDLSAADCTKCLEAAFAYFLPGCCEVKQGGRILFPSCNFRYELYPFYRLIPPQRFPSPPGQGKRNLSSGRIISILAAIVAFVGLLIAAFCFLSRKRRQRQRTMEEQRAANEITPVESLQFDLGTIVAATDKFAHENKLGEGGFGEVYKGILPSGHEIAVKRLLERSWQGDKEFKNEVAVVAKLQHRNLVRLLGFCLGREEKLLVFEFVPNRSLDCFLFGNDIKKRRELDWSTRYKIIKGIARGIQYLHEDSQPVIIHRDLKTSNILLDGEMNPKISDFGMARIIFGMEEQQGASTSKIVGTYGYMSPEYALHGQFSVKSDVYSFGVSIFEIISGKRTNRFYEVDGFEDLLSYSWRLWSEGTPLELLDATLRDSYSEDEVVRCIQIGLLCVQEDPTKRPTMTTIVLMLNGQMLDLEAPQQPASFYRYKDFNLPSNQLESNQSRILPMPSSVNEISISVSYPR